MAHRPLRRLLTSALIVLLHLPLIYHAQALHSALLPGQGIGDLGAGSLLLLVALFAMPYAALALAGIRWNPERARLNEYDV